MPPDLVFLDIEGKEAGRVSLARIRADSDAGNGIDGGEDFVLPDEPYRQLIEFLKYADTGTNRSIRVWFSKGKAEFEYLGVRYASLEQLKKHADLKSGFIVHLMRHVSQAECRMLYEQMASAGFGIEDMTVLCSHGYRCSAMPDKS